MDVLPALTLASLVLILIVGGLLAYRGHFKGWLMLKSIFPGWPGLAQLYLGVGLGCVLMYGLLKPYLPPLVVLLVAAVAFMGMVLGILGMFWLPSFLLPDWIKHAREEMRRGEDPYSQAMKPGGVLHGRLGVRREDWPSVSPEAHDRRSTQNNDPEGSR